MRPRVPLYGCSPRGVGTPLVESLTGFVNRLAVARHLPCSAVFDGLVRPLVPRGVVPDSHQLTHFFTAGVVVYDGLGPWAEALVVALTHLTGLPDLAFHTLRPWRPVLAPSRNGVRRVPKRWCASCLSDWRTRGVDPWEPLLWRLAPARRSRARDAAVGCVSKLSRLAGCGAGDCSDRRLPPVPRPSRSR